MRTSRISRDTSLILAATSSQRALRQKRSAVTPSQGTSSNTKIEDVGHEDNDEPGSSIDDGSNLSGSKSSKLPNHADKKRKRGKSDLAVVKHEKEEISISAIASPKKEVRPRKARRMPAKQIKSKDGGIKVEPPGNWEEVYMLTREMRNCTLAPVDTMGCESLAEKQRSPRDQRLQTLIALMLSSQTKDTVTAVAMRGMQENMPGGFNLESVLALDPTALNAFICKVGFHNLKTKYIKQTAEILRDKWNSDIPDSIEGLVSLPGVGPKMAYLTMSAAWGRDEGIGVDVHVHRITNLWGWHKTQQPEQTRASLESWLPRDKWHDINNLLVGFGQTICLPVGRKCGDCILADRGLCPSAVLSKSAAIKKEYVFTKIEDGTVKEGNPVVIQMDGVKAEVDVRNMPDIEDIGKSPRGRVLRRAAKKEVLPGSF